LGLALVQKLTDLHGGSVQVESKVGTGSRFTINLPWGQAIIHQQAATKSGAAALTTELPQTTNLPEPIANATILLAEDNAANVLTIGEYLESYGYNIVNAHDGLEAIQRAEESNPDIILMDIQMPVLDGLEAIRRLRADSRFVSTPIIVLTALAMPGDRERCLEAGANEYMSKPVHLKNLLHTIQEILRQKE
jgi:CheY-like chemotaxis protein